ncbi:MSC_0624 family F1-like ATPase-associated membrane protein [Mesomycoplasma molare]|uniref:Transmembrane protein n=1 Tax=Mesomycoplasma molare TaxID=171288 RepID=A0ABY5TX05_9BACT|nr:hypothetical protein [Mesomycoplasma molare]UWD34516.1 hypothetical protein NX772_01650 [Mesomycoplasma molare]
MKNKTLLVEENYLVKNVLFQKQQKFFLIFKIIILLIFAIYFNINYVSYVNLINITNNSLPTKIYFSFIYSFLNWLAYYFLFRTYIIFTENIIKIRYFLFWVVLYIFLSLVSFIFGYFLMFFKNNIITESEFKQYIIVILWIIFSILVINLSYVIFNYMLNKKFEWKKKYKNKWILISFISKFIYWIFAFKIYSSLILFLDSNENILDFYVIDFWINHWNLKDLIIKLLWIIFFGITFFPFAITMINFWETKKKVRDISNLIFQISLETLFFSIIWFIIKFNEKIKLSFWNYVFLFFCILIILAFLIKLFKKNNKTTNYFLNVFMVLSLFIIWTLFYLINIIYDLDSKKNIEGLYLSDVNLIFNSITSFFIIFFFSVKKKKIDKYNNIFIKGFISILLTILTFLFYLKSNNLFLAINDFLNIDILLYSIMLFYISVFLLINSWNNFLIFKNLKVGKKNEMNI